MSLAAQFSFFGVIAGLILFIGVFAYYSKDLPNPNSIQRVDGFSTQILDRESKQVLYDIYENKNRQFTPISEVPKALKDAVVAVEDKDFYKHKGFDPMSMLRIVKNVFTRQRVIGGSTVTQQLVKNVLLTNERRLSRKIKELVLAIQIERKFSKDEILQMYLNEVPYGGTTYGIAAASETYFNKTPKDLTLTEIAILAGMPQNPTVYSPYGKNPLAYVARATGVARRMREDGYITSEQEKQIVSELPGVSFKPKRTSLQAPHFVMYVKDLLIDQYGEDLVERGGLKVVTSLDYDLQQKAEAVVKEEIDKVAGPLHITNGASIMLDTHTGEILSMVGSRDFFDNEKDGQVNVVMAKRQPGSSIKPVTYATAFAKGYSPATMVMDTLTEFPSGDSDKPYVPENYDGKEHGPVSMRESLGSSLNIPAVKTLAMIGLKDMLDTAYKLGFSTLEPTKENMARFGLSVTLGGGEVKLLDLASGYSSFSNGGYKVEPISILKVTDQNGKVLFEHKNTAGKKIIDEKVAYLINTVLSDNNARLLTFGQNSLLNFNGRSIAVKTGTTNDRRDNWAIGWTKDTIVGVWVGNNDNSAMKQVASGVSGASPIWRRIMLDAISKRPDKPFDVPSGVEEVEVDKISGYRAHDGFASKKDWFISGTVPSEDDPIHKLIPVCKSDPSKLASAVQIAQLNYDTKEFFVFTEKDPLTPDNLWQKGIDKWLESQTESKYKPPKETCEQQAGVHVEIVEPKDKTKIDGNSVNIKIQVISDADIEWVDLYLNDNKEIRFDSRPFEKTYTLDNGIYKVRAVARNKNGVESDRVQTFGVNTDPNQPTPTPTQ
jgi:1A family penicillin-binding protein